MLAGCGKKEVTPTLDGITFDALVNMNGYSCICEIDLSGGGIFKSKVTDPLAIAGTEVTYDGSDVTITYMGLSYSPEMPLPGETLNDILALVLQSVATGSADAQEKDGSFIIEGETAGYDYTLYVTEAGLPLSLNCPRANFTAEFSNVKIK